MNLKRLLTSKTNYDPSILYLLLISLVLYMLSNYSPLDLVFGQPSSNLIPNAVSHIETDGGLGGISARKKIALGIPIGVNSASVEDLAALPGIGPALSKRIVEFRTAKGEITDLDELMQVHGIGDEKYKSILPLINLD